MMTHRQSWQLPLLILLSVPLWQNAAGRFLSIEHGTFAPTTHQDKSFTMEGVTFSQHTAGIQDITLHANRLSGTKDGATISLESVEANRLGAHPAHILSGNATYDPEREIVTMTDDVQVETDSLVLKTPAMRYLINHQTIKSAAEVTATGKQIVVNGTSFMYNLGNGNFRVGERVHFFYTPSPQP